MKLYGEALFIDGPAKNKTVAVPFYGGEPAQTHKVAYHEPLDLHFDMEVPADEAFPVRFAIYELYDTHPLKYIYIKDGS